MMETNTFTHFFQHLGAEDYELPHQLLIAHFAGMPVFLERLLGKQISSPLIIREEHKGLLDISIYDETRDKEHERFGIEVKMWSDLTPGQLKRQVEHIESLPYAEAHLFCLLLGTSADEWMEAKVKRLFQKDVPVTFISYPELANALRALIASLPEGNPDRPLAMDYLSILETQYRNLMDADLRELSEAKHPKHWYYARFRRIREAMPDWDFWVKTGGQNGQSGFTLQQFTDWVDYSCNGIKAGLFLEIIDNELCIRAHTADKDAGHRDALRQHLQAQLPAKLKALLGSQYALLSSNDQLSDYMKVARIKLPKEGLPVEGYCGLLRGVREGVENL